MVVRLARLTIHKAIKAFNAKKIHDNQNHTFLKNRIRPLLIISKLDPCRFNIKLLSTYLTRLVEIQKVPKKIAPKI